MSISIWQQCLARLQDQLTATEFIIWIRPLQAEFNENTLAIYAPNRFVLDWVQNKYLNNISCLLNDFCGTNAPLLRFEIGTNKSPELSILHDDDKRNNQINNIGLSSVKINSAIYNKNISYLQSQLFYRSNINSKHNFNNFIEGKSNQFAYSTMHKIVNNLGNTYNPLFLYGNTGLGKTHLLHAVGNDIIMRQNGIKVSYMHSERFVQNMVIALQNNAMEQFKSYYRSLNVLLVDDIQFFAHKERSQEEFFHILNALLEKNQQIILTSDRRPKEIVGVEDRLRSRFEWGLTVYINPPDLEMCISILMHKAEENDIYLSRDIAFFIAEHLHSNVRELEGAFNRILANANFTGSPITLDFVRESLRDLLILRKKLISINYILKVVSEYYKIGIIDLLSKSRARSIVRPRQIAMMLSRKFSGNSLSEIGDVFGGRDHTTVLYACKIIERLCKEDDLLKEDISSLLKILSL